MSGKQIPPSPLGLPNRDVATSVMSKVSHMFWDQIFTPLWDLRESNDPHFTAHQDWHSNPSGVLGVRQHHLRIMIGGGSENFRQRGFKLADAHNLYQEVLKNASNLMAQELPAGSWAIREKHVPHYSYTYGKYGSDFNAAIRDQEYLASNPELPVRVKDPELLDEITIYINVYYASDLKYYPHKHITANPKYKVGDRVKVWVGWSNSDFVDPTIPDDPVYAPATVASVCVVTPKSIRYFVQLDDVKILDTCGGRPKNWFWRLVNYGISESYLDSYTRHAS